MGVSPGPKGVRSVGWMCLSLECTSSRSRDRRVLCWSVGSCGMARLGRPPKQLPPPFPRTGSLALALSPPPPPSHVPPAAPPAVAAAAGGLTGVGGGADMTGRRGVRFARRFGGHQAEPIFFLALRSLGLCVHSLLLSGTLLQPLCSLSSHFSHSLTHFHSQLEFPIKTKSLHIFRAGARPLCKSGPLIAPPTTLMVWAGSPP